MEAERTCFVIAPIGELDSDTRQAADDFFDLIVQPAVEKYGFSVVRADKIAGTGSITEDVLRLVQESDLCIVDLTGQNPNVFYECGRRHEAGRPCIQLIEGTEQIPFNLAGIRTIKYQLGDPRAIRRTVTEVQAFISEITKAGFSGASSGASMSSIAEALTRIERRLANIETARRSMTPSRLTAVKSLFQNPLKAMQEAMIQGDLSMLVDLLPRLESTTGVESEAVIQTATIVALNGLPDGADVLRRALAGTAKLSPRMCTAAVSGLVQYYVARSEEREGCELVKSIVEKNLADRSDLEKTDRAFLHNQLSILQHGAGEYADGLASLEKALKLSPDDRAYWHNISIIYERLALPEKACDAALRSIADLKSPDVDHLAHAYEVLNKANRTTEASEALKILEEIDPARAAIVSK
ncbi:MAG: tetratricopeptide repeat protein [Acidobacteria bacterium]|nr:tetratricopeptide repeat protein [Acidobacteriota bacterium]